MLAARVLQRPSARNSSKEGSKTPPGGHSYRATVPRLDGLRVSEKHHVKMHARSLKQKCTNRVVKGLGPERGGAPPPEPVLQLLTSHEANHAPPCCMRYAACGMCGMWQVRHAAGGRAACGVWQAGMQAGSTVVSTTTSTSSSTSTPTTTTMILL